MNSIYGNIDDLYLFCAVVEHGSLLAAAEYLNLPVSTMSRRLSGLESRLNIRLLEKQGRELVATQLGQSAFASLTSGMEQLEHAFSNLQSEANEVQGSLKLALPHNLYQGFAGKVIEEFLQSYPKVKLELILSQQQVTPETDRDLLITFDVSPMQGMIARPLFNARHGFFASPTYLAQHEKILSAQDLKQHSWVSVDHITTIPVFEGNELIEQISISPKLIVNDILAVIRATEAGLGIASLPFRHVSPSAHLEQVLPEYHRSERQAYLVYKERTYQPKALTLLIDALLSGIHQMQIPYKGTT
ncbi:LysR family transcriptional regulator [Vibrio tapetis subsp. quintayensis]|uniref:LysR family transcriptional regulator n=1 Tax=Vibrio tapetis TaxID=52443 RepID=UPI0025B44E84|nr:LysR family transcriptional regulator [Vibrio tapetis]MDN3680787.1 LysR family transcriptional regulator [Vibrio tapetis subsp. quintayensis]